MNYLNQNSRGSLADFRREMDRFFDDFWASPGLTRQPVGTLAPACDIEEAEQHYLISLEMPGVAKDQIKVEVHGNLLTVKGERRQESKKKEGAQWYSERQFGTYQRSFTLPTGVDSGKVEAHYEDGILRLYVPKAEAAGTRQIEISQGAEGKGFFGRFLGNSKKPNQAA